MPDTDGAPAEGWQRHHLLRVAPETWAATLARGQVPAGLPLAESWAEQGWPVIVRRRSPEDDQTLVPVGLALPPAAGKGRIALAVPAKAVLRCTPPPTLREAAIAAPEAWRTGLTALLALGGKVGIEPRCFGSLLWQHQTGLPYLTPHSDLDLLWSVSDGFDVPQLLDGIAEAEPRMCMRVDGEIAFPDGSAVNWRELWLALRHADRAGVLAKTAAGVRLVNLAPLVVAGASA